MGHSEAVNGRSTDNTMVKRKRTNNDLKNTTHKTNDRATRTPLATIDELRCPGRVKIRVTLGISHTTKTNKSKNTTQKTGNSSILYDTVDDK